STNSGELTGTPIEVGEYPITFTARDGATGEVLTLTVDFVVLPPYGGDASSISTNLWVTTEKLKTSVPAKDSWIGQGIWNAGPRLPQDRLRRLQGRPQGRRCGQGLGNAFPLPGRSEFPLRE